MITKTGSFLFILIIGFISSVEADDVSNMRQSCENGDAASCSALGTAYDHGKGVEQDDEKAKKYYEQACHGGVGDACYELGSAYGEKREYDQAAQFYTKSCEYGQFDGCAKLGWFFEKGMGLPSRNLHTAIELYALSCGGGSEQGCSALGAGDESEKLAQSNRIGTQSNHDATDADLSDNLVGIWSMVPLHNGIANVVEYTAPLRQPRAL